MDPDPDLFHIREFLKVVLSCSNLALEHYLSFGPLPIKDNQPWLGVLLGHNHCWTDICGALQGLQMCFGWPCRAPRKAMPWGECSGSQIPSLGHPKTLPGLPTKQTVEGLWGKLGGWNCWVVVVVFALGFMGKLWGLGIVVCGTLGVCFVVQERENCGKLLVLIKEGEQWALDLALNHMQARVLKPSLVGPEGVLVTVQILTPFET